MRKRSSQRIEEQPGPLRKPATAGSRNVDKMGILIIEHAGARGHAGAAGNHAGKPTEGTAGGPSGPLRSQSEEGLRVAAEERRPRTLESAATVSHETYSFDGQSALVPPVLEAGRELPQAAASSLPYHPLDFARDRSAPRDGGPPSPVQRQAEAEPQAQGLSICTVGPGQLPGARSGLQDEKRQASRMKNQLIMNQNFSLLSSRMKAKRLQPQKRAWVDGTKSAVITTNLPLHQKPVQKQKQHVSLHRSKMASPPGVASPASCGVSQTLTAVTTEHASGAVRVIAPRVPEGLPEETDGQTTVAPESVRGLSASDDLTVEPSPLACAPAQSTAEERPRASALPVQD